MAQTCAQQLAVTVDLVDVVQTNTVFRYEVLSTGKRIRGDSDEVESFETLAYGF